MPPAKKTLSAFFDLSVSPIGYDFIDYLIMAEISRIEHGCESFQVVIVPAPGHGFRDDPVHDQHFDLAQKRWRITNILAPACALVSGCHGFHHCTDRDEARHFYRQCVDVGHAVFPDNYTIDEPKAAWEPGLPNWAAAMGKTIPSLRASKQALAYVRTWMDHHAKGERVVSITLREAGWQQTRNSDLDEWCKFAQWLTSARYLPVFVRDTDRTFEAPDPPLSDFAIFSPAAINMEIRLAFYELSYASLFVANGPTELAKFDDGVRYINYKVLPPERYKTEANPHAHLGLLTGAQLPFGTPYHRWSWETDRFDVLQREFESLSTAIDSSDGRAFERNGLRRELTTIERLDIAHLYRTNNRGPLARAIYDQLRQICESWPEYKLWMTDLEVMAGDREAARLYFDAAISQAQLLPVNEKQARFCIEVGDRSLKIQEFATAESLYKRAIDFPGCMLESYIRLGLTCQFTSRHDDALQWYDRALELAPDNQFVKEKRAEAAKDAGRIDEAIAHWMSTRIRN